MKCVIFSIMPSIHVDKVTDVTWNFTFHDRRVSSDYIFVVSLNFIVLDNSLKKRANNKRSGFEEFYGLELKV